MDLVSKVGALSASVKHLEQERSSLLTQLEEEKTKNAKILQESEPRPHHTNTTPTISDGNDEGYFENKGSFLYFAFVCEYMRLNLQPTISVSI